MNRPQTLVLAFSAGISFMPAQSWADMTCAEAPSQLQQYIVQVNQVANSWLYGGIPGRCGYNQYCRGMMLQQLNYWYQQQTALVNQWYYRISAACTDNSSHERHHFDPVDPSNSKMDDNDTKELEVDKNESKTVTIVIPDNPSGFNGQ